jgi:hypothetical protein
MKKFCMTANVIKAYTQSGRTWTYSEQVPAYFFRAASQQDAEEMAQAIVRFNHTDRPQDEIHTCVVEI